MSANADYRSISRCLIVEDDAALASAISKALTASVRECHIAPTIAAAERALEDLRPELAILDIRLPDGTIVELLQRARGLEPWPTLIAISGEGDVGETFRLAQLGVREFLRKPLDVAQLLQAVDRVRSSPPDWVPLVKNMVGHRQLMAFEDDVRRTMVDQALQRTDGSLRGAAKLLSVTRQALQHMLRRRP